MDLWGFHNGQEVWKAEADPSMAYLFLGTPVNQDKVYVTYHKNE